MLPKNYNGTAHLCRKEFRGYQRNIACAGFAGRKKAVCGDIGETFRLAEALDVFERDRFGQWQLATISAGEEVSLAGASDVSGCIELVRGKELYSALLEDVARVRGTSVTLARSAGSELVMSARAGAESPEFALSVVALSCWFQNPAEFATPNIPATPGLEL